MSSVAGRPPLLSPAAVCKLVSRFFRVKNVVEDSVKALPSYDDANYYFRGELVDSKFTEFVLKLGNPVRTPFPVMKGLNKLMHHISSQGFKFATPYPLCSIAGTDLLSLTAEKMTTLSDEESFRSNGTIANDGNMEYHVYLLPFIPGIEFDAAEKESLTPTVLRDVGETLAKIDKELREHFLDESISASKSVWDLMFFTDLKHFLGDVDDPGRQAKAEIVFKYFEDHVMPRILSFGKGIVHGDFNGLNIILDKSHTGGSYKVAGIVDFGDCCETCTVFDLGICLAYIITENMNPFHCSSAIEFVGPVIQGYHAVSPLTPDEFDSLYYLALARCVQSAVIGAHAFKAEPWNAYLLTTPEKAWTVIDLLLSATKEVVDRTWKRFLL